MGKTQSKIGGTTNSKSGDLGSTSGTSLVFAQPQTI